MRQKPEVLAREIVASSRLFRVEEVQLRFSNGVERTYERLVGRGNGYGAVMIVAMADAEHALVESLPDLHYALLQDADAILEGDPAARSPRAVGRRAGRPRTGSRPSPIE